MFPFFIDTIGFPVFAVEGYRKRNSRRTYIILLRLFMRSEKVTAWVLDTLREAAWAPFVVFLFYLIARSLQLYNLFPPLDIPTHFLGGVVITYFYRVAIRNSQNMVGEIPFPIQVTFAFTCTGTTAILWELYEYMFDFFFDANMVRGVTDTTVDFIVGLLGALVLSIFYRRRYMEGSTDKAGLPQ
jgi:hypothetical protein